MTRPRWPWRASVAQEVENELAFHLEMTTRELMERGMTRQAARAEAERRFGDRAAVNAECQRYGSERDRKERRAEYLSELTQDATFALRQLARARGFTAVAVLTLALGIGATATMFSALDAVVLRPLPFNDADRVVVIRPMIEGQGTFVSPPEFLAYRDAGAFEFVAAARPGGGVTLQLGDIPEMIDAASVTADYFAVLGVRPALGRTFTREEDAAGGPPAAILSHRFWVSRFNGDPSVINRVVRMDEIPRTIVGVMPASFDYARSTANIWIPLAFGPEDATRFGAHYLRGLGRLKRGVTIEQARAAAAAAEVGVARRIEKRTRPLSSYGADVRRFSDDLVGNNRALLFILLGAVGFVLLIACGNVANLLLARGASRARELAVRAALGAGRGRLVRQLLTESLVLSMAGVVAGLGVALGLLRILRLVSPQNVPRIDQAAIDWRVLTFTLLLGVLSTVLFGLAPALRAVRPHLQQTLREGGRGSAGVARDRLRPFLVGAQVALTLALLVGAALLIRSGWQIQHVDPGFSPRGVLTARVVLPGDRYKDGEAITRALSAVRDEAAHIPGVESVALTSVVPLSDSRLSSTISGEDRAPGEHDIDANLRMVSDGYFHTMRIPLVAGRDISPTDRAESTPVMVVNESLVRALWPNIGPRDALGKRLRVVPTRRADAPNWEIVGVVGDLHDAALTKRPIAEMYAPYAQTEDHFWPFLGRSLVVVMRQAGAGSPESLTRQLQQAVARVDPLVPITDSKSMEDYLRDSLATGRMNTLLLSTLGIIALVLATVGIYGVVSYFVSQRTQEIGIRVALGSTPQGIWRLVVERSMRPIGVGIGLGAALSLVTSTLLRSQLFGVAARDPLTIVGVAALLVAVAVVAIYVPARRAMRVSPIVALTAL